MKDEVTSFRLAIAQLLGYINFVVNEQLPITCLEQECLFPTRGCDQGNYSPQLPIMLETLLGTGTGSDEDASDFNLDWSWPESVSWFIAALLVETPAAVKEFGCTRALWSSFFCWSTPILTS